MYLKKLYIQFKLNLKSTSKYKYGTYFPATCGNNVLKAWLYFKFTSKTKGIGTYICTTNPAGGDIKQTSTMILILFIAQKNTDFKRKKESEILLQKTASSQIIQNSSQQLLLIAYLKQNMKHDIYYPEVNYLKFI